MIDINWVWLRSWRRFAYMMAWLCLWRPCHNKYEYSLKLPLGIWRGSYYHLARLEFSVGWHYHYLLMVWDWPAYRVPNKYEDGWRFQQQMKHTPIKGWSRLLPDIPQ